MAIAPQHTPLQASDSQEEARWLRTRESSDAPSEPSTPATSHFRDNNTPSGARSRSDSTSVAQPALNIDAEDEDVKIAIMALGAMKNLDGSSRSRGRSIDGGAGPSSRSVSSTTISSPSSSTPATDQTAYTLASSSTSTSSSTPATLADLPPDFRFPAIVYDENGNEMRVDREDLNDADFLQRVSHLPIVRGTLRAYEMGKQRSRVMRYGGNLVESSVKAISRPVVSRIGAHLGGRGVEQLDDFACRQLDRIYPYASDRFSKEERETVRMELEEKERTEWQDMPEEERVKRRQAYMAQKLEERERAALLRDSAANASSQQHQQSGGYPVAQHSGMPARSSSYSASMDQQQAKGVQNRQRDRSASDMQRNALIRAHSDNPASRTGSGWSSMLVEAGVTAGGLSAAMSEESMKSLKYCLQWLQYATAHIEHQITILRDLIVKLNHGELDLTSPAAENLSNIKRDVVLTIRNVVDVVGKYAGGALPEPARASVKAFILSLPARWATVNRASNGIEGRSGAFGGSPSSPSFSALHSSQGNGSSTSAAPEGRQTAGTVARQQAAATAAAANRILTLAVESLDILRSVTVVFGESLDRADLWVERLRVLGLQRKRAHEQAAAEEAAARIDAGMGGALARSGHWELSRGMHLHGSQSPGAESNMSISTSASSKRRRVKRRNTLRGSTSPFAAESRSPAPEEEDEGAQSEEGSSTETERAAMARSHSSSSHPSSSAGAGLSSAHQHFQHPHGSTMAHRRAAVKARGNGGRHPSSAVRASPVSTVSGTTPALQELSLRDSPSAPDSTTKKS